MAQVIRYYEYPNNKVSGTFTVTVDKVNQARSLRGGTGNGGAYDWTKR